MLRVAINLLDLDKCEDIDGVKEGYTEALLHAIKDQDKLYEVEVIKSLGDVSLHEGSTSKNVEDIKKAERLYSAALRRCEDPDGKESLEHRVKCASKQTERLIGQKRKKQNSDSYDVFVSEPSISHVSETLLSVDKAVENITDFHHVRVCYASTLVSAMMCNSTLLEVETLKSIGDVSLQMGKRTQNAALLADAMGLYRGALGRCVDTDGHESLLHRIRYTENVIERMMIIQARGTPEKAKLSDVVEGFRELDLIFETGYDLHVVERGYARKLIYALSIQDKVLECEALKSLGDLYLHKAKMTENKAENFHKACALYQEASARCASRNQKQAALHRIRYAEKCTKLVYDQQEVENSAKMTHLAVWETLNEMSKKTKLKGHGLMLLIESYTKTFVTAIVVRNKCLEVECLKSLGDLYLEKGMVGRNETELTRAAGLYRAALDRCGDVDGRETLEHRIKYTVRVKERGVKKRQATALSGNRNPYMFTSPSTSYKPAGVAIRQRTLDRTYPGEGNTQLVNTGDTPQENDNSIYQDHLQEGCRALQTADLDRAELSFAAAIKSVHVQGQHTKEVDPLCMLGEVYLKRGIQSKDGGDFTKAAALCNAALVRSKRDDRAGIQQRSFEALQLFVKHVLNIEQMSDNGDVEKNKMMLKESRDCVEIEMKIIDEQADPYSLEDDDPKIREVERKRAEAIKTLCQKIGDQRKTFIAGLVYECMEVIGPPPCKYAMIGLGSQATELVTPYSDLEFAILIEEETDNNVDYFRNLTHYLHLKVISLGETILPAMAIKSLNDFYSDDPTDNWYYDSITPRGFAFDGAMPHACKTPLGRGQTSTARSELIQTPSKMTKILKDDLRFHLKKGYHLASILGNVCLITGEQDLVDEYTALWAQQLEEHDRLIPSLIAQTDLRENSQIFEVQDLTGSLLNVKKEIYRFASLAVQTLALTHNIQPTTIWETIQKLLKNRVINSENAHHLMVLVSISAELRLRTYMNNRGQVENMSALCSVSTDTDSTEKLTKVFYCSNTKQLMRYYYTENPLKNFIKNGTQSKFYDNSPELQAEVYRSLCDYDNFKTCAKRALQSDMSKYGENSTHHAIAASLNKLAEASAYLGENRTAVMYYEKSLQMKRSIYGGNTAHPGIAGLLRNLGTAWMKLGDHQKAVSHYEQALQIKRNIHGENTAHPDIAGLLSNLGTIWTELGDNRKAVTYCEQSLQMMRGIYGETAAHLDIAGTLNNLGNAWNYLDDYTKAIKCYEQALQMERSVYGETTAHPDIALSLSNLGAAWDRLADYRKAVRHHEQSLRIMRIIYGEGTVHPDIALALTNLSITYNMRGDYSDYREAVRYGEQALQMRRSIHGENTAHPDIAQSLGNLAPAYRRLGEARRAIRYGEQSLQMRRRIYGENIAHPYTAYSLFELGNAWGEFGYQTKSVGYHEQALQMLRCIHGENTAHLQVAASLISLGDNWRLLDDHRKAASYYEQALQILRSIHGENTAHPDIANALDRLGVAWGKLGDRQAIRHHKQALQMRRSVHGKNTAHRDIVESLTNLGLTLGRLGDHRQAISCHEQALQTGRRIYGENTGHSDVAKSLNNLGITWRKLGDYRKAVMYYEQALQMWRSIPGEDTARRYIAGTLDRLGMAWGDLGDHRKAVSYGEQALQMRRSIHGENTAHPEIAASLHNLGNAWSDLGDNRKAVSYGEQALQMMRSIYGEGTAHSDITISLSSLGSNWRKLGDYKKAVSYYVQALQMKNDLYGENTAHSDIAGSLFNLGNAWSDLGDYRKAVMYYEQALQMWRSIYSGSTAHPHIAASLHNLGNAWGRLDNYRKAENYFEQALQMKRRIYSEKTAHPDIASSLNNLGHTWSLLGDHRKAVSYHEQALQMRRSIHGQNSAHPDIAASLNNLGTAWSLFRDQRKAVRYHEQALQMRRTIYGENTAHHDIIKSLCDLGTAWSKVGDHRKAVRCYGQALQMKRGIHGKPDVYPGIGTLLEKLGTAWEALGDARKAISFHEQALQMRRSIYGENTVHPDIADSLHNLGIAWMWLDYRNAVRYLEQALQMRRTIYGENTWHFDIADSLHYLGWAWMGLVDLGKALKYFKQLFQIGQSVPEELAAHPGFLKARTDWGISWQRLEEVGIKADS